MVSFPFRVTCSKWFVRLIQKVLAAKLTEINLHIIGLARRTRRSDDCLVVDSRRWRSRGRGRGRTIDLGWLQKQITG